MSLVVKVNEIGMGVWQACLFLKSLDSFSLIILYYLSIFFYCTILLVNLRFSRLISISFGGEMK